ncbi:hypothetical protein O181_057393 [Austropuccinia psidii MF-1]|uniref:HAT C-terminal dimerisation domain-containing protein n=1 Tax=Austropuccinia psidii MF-1 TaxID=1389203 RepID=A0A9Q3EEX3_9BASI|nr:hypothetical protein [Austropuccinia psidii MF-1]
MSDTESLDLLTHLQQMPIEASYNELNSHYDEVGTYLQNLNPMVRGEKVMDYWKRQILSGHYPDLGKLAFKYLSIPSSSASVERVFSHSGRLKSPTRASLGSRTIAHLTCLKEWLNNEFPPF